MSNAFVTPPKIVQKPVHDLEHKKDENVVGRVSQIELIETDPNQDDKVPILKSDGKNITYEDVLKHASKEEDCMFHTRTKEFKDYKESVKTALTHNKVLMS